MSGEDDHLTRESWDAKYRAHDDREFLWFTDEPPAELSRLLGSGRVPAGAALDVGCGPGIVAAFLSATFSPTVAFDIAHEAVVRARANVQERGGEVRFVTAAAPVFPFRDGSFAFVFDRGCLQNVPRPRWPEYFREAERVLGRGGVLQILTHNLQKPRPPLLSPAGLKARVLGPSRERRKRAAMEQRIRAMAPDTLEFIEFRFPEDRGEHAVRFFEAILRKR